MAANAVFDWAHKFSEHTHRIAERRQVWADLMACNRCGACQHWMKSRDCPREHNVNGQTRGPSSGGIPCSKFAESKRSAEHREKLQARYAELSDTTKAARAEGGTP